MISTWRLLLSAPRSRPFWLAMLVACSTTLTTLPLFLVMHARRMTMSPWLARSSRMLRMISVNGNLAFSLSTPPRAGSLQFTQTVPVVSTVPVSMESMIRRSVSPMFSKMALWLRVSPNQWVAVLCPRRWWLRSWWLSLRLRDLFNPSPRPSVLLFSLIRTYFSCYV